MNAGNSMLIKKCPNPECRKDVKLITRGEGKNIKWWTHCEACGYRGPDGIDSIDGPRLHNLIASAIPTAAVKELEAEMRKYSPTPPTAISETSHKWADKLAALIREAEGGK